MWILESNREVIVNRSLLDPYMTAFSSTFWGLIVGLPILYYCAFKKHGTRLLTISIWCSIPFLLIWAASLIISIGTIIGLNFDSYHQMFFEELSRKYVIYNEDNWFSFFITSTICEVLCSIIAVFILRYEISLRKRNNIFQYKGTLKCDTYKQAYDLIDSTTNHEQLQIIYSQLMSMLPEIKKFLEFKNNKKRILLTEVRKNY